MDQNLQRNFIEFDPNRVYVAGENDEENIGVGAIIG